MLNLNLHALIKQIKNNKFIKIPLVVVSLLISLLFIDCFITTNLQNITLSMVQPQLKAVLVHTKTIFEKHESTLNYITSEFENIEIDKLTKVERDIICADLTRKILTDNKVKNLLRELYNYKIISEMEYIYILTRINKKYYFVITDEMIEIRGFNVGKPLLLTDYTLLNKAFEKGTFHTGKVTDEHGQHYSALWLIRKGYLLGADYNLGQGLYLVIEQIKYYGLMLLIVCACLILYIKVDHNEQYSKTK